MGWEMNNNNKKKTYMVCTCSVQPENVLQKVPSMKSQVQLDRIDLFELSSAGGVLVIHIRNHTSTENRVLIRCLGVLRVIMSDKISIYSLIYNS